MIDASLPMKMIQHHLDRAKTHEESGRFDYAMGSYRKAKKWQTKLADMLSYSTSDEYFLTMTFAAKMLEEVEHTLLYGHPQSCALSGILGNTKEKS